MKKLLLLMLLGFVLFVNGQSKRTELFTKSFGGVNISQDKLEDANSGIRINTSLSFQNQKYQQISDIKYIFMYSKADIDLLILKFDNALVFSKSGENSEMEYEDKKIKFNITADGKNGRITLWSYSDVPGYIFVHPKNIAKIIEALKAIKENYGK